MRVLQRVIFPFAPPARPNDVVVAVAERGLCALVHHVSKWSHPHVLAAAERGLRAHLQANPDARANAETLRALVDRIARAVRQTGERLELAHGNPSAIANADGHDFSPNRALEGFEANPELALVWIAEDDAFLATIGACAVVRCVKGRIEPLHSLDTLAHANPEHGMGRAADWIVVRMLGMDPDDLAAGVSEQYVKLEPGDILMLLSPRIATAVVEFGMRPTTRLDDLDGLAQWLATLVEVDAERPEDAVGAMLLLQHEA